MPGKHRDLCWVCNHGSRGVNRGTTARPVFYCEEFDAYVPVSHVSLEQASRTTPNGKGGSGRLTGLCTDCENRKTCMLRGPEGGVWHCEEYQ